MAARPQRRGAGVWPPRRRRCGVLGARLWKGTRHERTRPRRAPIQKPFFAQAAYTYGAKPNLASRRYRALMHHRATFSPIRFLQLKSAQKSDIYFSRFRNFSASFPTRPSLGETPMVLMTWAKLAQGRAVKNAESKHLQSSPRQVDRRPQKIDAENDITRSAFLHLL